MSNHIRNLLIALAVTVIWFFIMRPFTPPNIVAFELAGTPQNASSIIRDWEQTSSVKTSIYLDFGFIIAYCSAFMFACRAAANYSGVPFFIKTAKQLVFTIWIAGFCDAVENIAMLKTLNAVSKTSVSIAFYFATIKFGILLIALIFILFCLPLGVFNKLRN